MADSSSESIRRVNCLGDCFLDIVRALGVGSCIMAESRSPTPSSPVSGIRKKRPREGDRKEEQVPKTPGKLFVNGSSEMASLFMKQGKKGVNQDAMVVWENFASRTDTVFCGVFDGHGPLGHMVAKRVRDTLPLKLSSNWEVNIKSDEVLKEISLNTASSMNSENGSSISPIQGAVPFVNDVEKEVPDIFNKLTESFLKAYKGMDRELRSHKNVDCFWSGTTAVTLVIQGKYIVIGNVGDSRAVMGTRDKDDALVAVQLTVDHKPNHPAEAERIKKCRGRVFSLKGEPGVFRVWRPNSDFPGLAMARSFGDFCLKDYGLISVPEITCLCTTDKDDFVVLATDGIWDVLSNEEVVKIVASAPTRSYSARSLVESAVKAWRCKYPTSKVDDCAAVCLFLDSTPNNVYTASDIEMKEKLVSKKERNVKGDVPSPTEVNRSGTLPNSANTGTGDDEDFVIKEKSLSKKEMNVKGAVPSPTEVNPSVTLPCPENTTIGYDEDFIIVEEEELYNESGIDWSALEGVSRGNTIVAMSGYVPEEEKENDSETNVRK